MAKMTQAQRIAILDFHNGVTNKCQSFTANAHTIAALVRHGWAIKQHGCCAAYVTTAGLLAAGVDMDAIHAEAIEAEELEATSGWGQADGMVGEPVTEVPVYCGSRAAHGAHGVCGGSTVDVPSRWPQADGMMQAPEVEARMRLPEVSGRWAGATETERAGLLVLAHDQALNENATRRARKACGTCGEPVRQVDDMLLHADATNDGHPAARVLPSMTIDPAVGPDYTGGEFTAAMQTPEMLLRRFAALSVAVATPKDDRDVLAPFDELMKLRTELLHRMQANTPAETLTGISDRVAAALTDLAEVRRIAHVDGPRYLLTDALDRIEATLRGQS
jgi:hypothetical protein